MTTIKITMTFSADSMADAGYIDTEQRGPDRQVARTIPIRTNEGHLYGALDLADDGALLGIELLGISKLLPDTQT